MTMEQIIDLRLQGGPTMYAGWTEHGLKLIEKEFIIRIRGQKLKPRKHLQAYHTDDICKDISKSPLDHKIKRNLMENVRIRKTDYGFDCKPIFEENI